MKNKINSGTDYKKDNVAILIDDIQLENIKKINKEENKTKRMVQYYIDNYVDFNYLSK